MKFRLIMVALLFVGLATTTQANTILNVLVDQKISIENGYRFGKISYFDARDLMREQARIEKVILKANKDGVITDREQAKIIKLQRRADRNIWIASSLSTGFYRNSTSYFDQYDPWNNYGYGWNQGYFYGANCYPAPQGTTTSTPSSNPTPKSKPMKVERRN